MNREEGTPALLRVLLGTWRGAGEGTWPSSGPFSYQEEMSFDDGGAGPEFPFVSYVERAWDPESGLVLHQERGFWTVTDGSTIEVVLAHPIGVAEVTVGTFRDGVIELEATALAASPGGLPVTAFRRTYRLADDVLTYEQYLGVEDQHAEWHLRAELHRDC